MDRAVSYLISNYNPKGRWIGWLMMASIIVEAWDLYSIAFVLIFIRDTFHPTPALLGLAAAGTQGGAVIGALLGGWLADRLGRARPSPTAFLADIRKDPIRWRATLFGWIACFAQSGEFSTFAFYLPVLFVMVGVSGVLGTTLVTLALYIIAAISGWIGPLITPRIGQRGLSIAGFAIVFLSLLVAAAALYTGHVAVLPFAAAAMLWGHYWDAENVVTIPAVVARPEYRGTATGFAYVFVKLPAFLSIFLFPVLFSAIGQANATLLIALFPLAGLLAAIFILPEIYGFEHD
jgi:MFS family permease